MCEHKNELKFAESAATKAVQTKKECQGEDFPDFVQYVEVLRRIKTKKLAQQT